MKNILSIFTLAGLLLLFVAGCEKKEEPKPAEEQATRQATEASKDTVAETKQPEEVIPEGWAKLEKPMTGVVTAFSSIMRKGESKLSVEETKKRAQMGDPIGLMVGDVFYFVFKEDGSNASAELAALADKPGVEVTGFMKNQNGMNVLMAKEIKPVEVIQ